MNLENAKATFGLTARSEMTAPGTSGSDRQLLGVAPVEVSFPNADICYSFKVTATASSDDARLVLSTGVVSATDGSPTITDGAGDDFEGNTLPTLVRLYALFFHTDATNSGGVSIVPTFPPYPDITMQAGEMLLWADPSGDTTLGNLDFAMVTNANSITVTVIGKSS